MELVSPQEALNRVTEGLAYGIDVREQEEWDKGRSALFTFMALSNFDVGLLPKDKPIIFICRSGKRSATACALAEDEGLTALNMDGGMLAWQEAGLPLVADGRTPEIS